MLTPEQCIQGSRVQFEIGDLIGTGQIVGVTSIGASDLFGRAFIIDPDESIANDTYPYSHFTCFEMALTPVE